MAYEYEEFKRDVFKLTDIDLNLYKERQMKRRIDTLIQRKGYDGYESFYKGMRQDEILLRTFVSYLTINVSQFYRNPVQWEIFENKIIPYLKANYGNELTIWSAACSTGDEPYTIAMILSKYMPLDKVKIIASDIDEDVLAFAKNGIYPDKSLVDLPKEYIDKFFRPFEKNKMEINDNLKRCVTFVKHNLLKDEFFSDINMVVCRNVVIYFTDDAKNEIYNKFNKSLKKDGILFIGNTEQILKCRNYGFDIFDSFFYKKIN